MSTISNFLKASLVATSLLLATAANAGDVTSDRAQAAASAKPGVAERHPASGDARHSEDKACHCATVAPKAAPEKSLLDDPNFTGYQPG
jgi:hypothetical protein